MLATAANRRAALFEQKSKRDFLDTLIILYRPDAKKIGAFLHRRSARIKLIMFSLARFRFTQEP